ncbi:sigma-54 interaction domain-containing protein [Thalassovita sp.]|uniref:sigma-54 interaction domain-containing protein n=1 Tax=Thalassovita sp. TaxID=1979401 RepID=UPI002B2658A8|nr:sigma 54-interacting transcriptional regulator [Thalassovita sp.]
MTNVFSNLFFDAEAPILYEIDALIVGSSPATRRMKQMLTAVSPSDAPVMLSGDTGSGKERAATAIHQASGRSGKLVAVNCAAIPGELLESELFGYEKGAFTGAEEQRVGLIEMADGGTLFLDEIGDMPMALQSKLLRVLEAREIQRVGGRESIAVDFRLITATHRRLTDSVAEGKFRADLFYRINVLPVPVPPLAERLDEIPELIDRMLSDHTKQHPHANLPHFAMDAIERLQAHNWPGNIRELRNVVDRAIVMFPGRMLHAGEVDNFLLLIETEGENTGKGPGSGFAVGDQDAVLKMLRDKGAIDIRLILRDMEISMIEGALQMCEGNVTGAAQALGLQRTTLIEKIKKYGIQKP